MLWKITPCLAALAAAIFLLLPPETAAADKLPNIVFILADDLGYGDIACYNSESKIPTPNIDRLAREGMLFTDAHSPSTVCTPTRYSVPVSYTHLTLPTILLV